MSRRDEAWGRYRLMCAVDDPGPIERAFRDAWERQERLIASVHERVACPRCGAPVGERCRSLPKGYRHLGPAQRVLLTPHKQRLRADGISLR